MLQFAGGDTAHSPARAGLEWRKQLKARGETLAAAGGDVGGAGTADGGARRGGAPGSRGVIPRPAGSRREVAGGGPRWRAPAL
jgi:hypothetical protein